MPVALIVGVTGQDGAYLSQLLLGKGYTVHGTSRDANLARLHGLTTLGIRDQVTLHTMSSADFQSVAATIDRVGPDEVYDLSGQSSVALSFLQPAQTMESHVLSALHVLEYMRRHAPRIRYYFSGSSECFGDTSEHPADENTAFRPKSPYAIAKAAAVFLVTNYRESYGLFACSGLLFNHESPLRPPHFVTRKITSAAARISRGSAERLPLGNLSIRRDWGWAADYVVAMAAMLAQPAPDDFVIATGAAHSLEEFVGAAFAEAGLTWRDHVDIDPSLARPSDIWCSVGNAAKAATHLGWRPKVGFPEIVARMVRAELELPPSPPGA